LFGEKEHSRVDVIDLQISKSRQNKRLIAALEIEMFKHEPLF
jgi:hypothetical protein